MLTSMLLKDAEPPRPMWLALAHCIVPLHFGNAEDRARYDLLTRIFVAMKPAAQMLCRNEIARLRAIERETQQVRLKHGRRA